MALPPCGTLTPRLMADQIDANESQIEQLSTSSDVYIQDSNKASSDFNAAPTVIAALTSLTKGQTLSSFTSEVQLTEVVDYSLTSGSCSMVALLSLIKPYAITQSDNGFKLTTVEVSTLRHINIGITAYSYRNR